MSRDMILPEHLHELREREAVVEITLNNMTGWLNCRDGVILECPICKKRGTKTEKGGPVALDTRAAKSMNGVRGMMARVWQGLTCLRCEHEITVVLVYPIHN